MKNPSLNAAARRLGKLAACLMLGLAALPQAARSAPSYSAAALANNPLGFWQLNETGDPSSGALPAADTSGNGLNGTYGATSLNGGHGIVAPQPPTYQGFAVGQGALHTSASDVTSPVTLPALNLHTNAVTIAMWINPNGPIPTFTGLLMNRAAGNDAAGLGFGGSTDANTMAALGYTWNTNAGNTWGYNSGLFPIAGTWQFVAMVIRTNSATFYLYYIDPNTSTPVLRSAVNNIPHTPQAFASGATFIGSDVVNAASPDSTRVFNGEIAGVAVYRAALSADQILTMFAAGVGVNGFAPSVATQPQSRYILSGSTTQLRTAVNGSSPLSYQWRLNGTNVNLLPNSANYTGANSNILTILSASAAEAGTYQLVVTNLYGAETSSNATISIQAPALVGKWFTNGTLSDVSGFNPAGKHDGYAVGGTIYAFTNDVPTGKTGQSLWLYNGDSAIAISNSSTLDETYANTFDERVNNAMTVAVWAKGWPAGWAPFVSKWGEAGVGWQLRQAGDNNQEPCWTVRGAGGTLALGRAAYGNTEDLVAAGLTLASDTNNWHFYVGTFNAVTGVRHLYVDGQRKASVTNGTLYALAPEAFLVIGGRDNDAGVANFGNFFNGLIYDTRVYNYALSEADIQGLYGVVPASIAVQPSSVSAFAGEPVTLNVAASGTAPLSYQWQLNGTNVNLLPNSANYAGANSNQLTILSLAANAAGTYRVIVTNLYASVTSSNATVSLEQPKLVGRWFNGSSSLADVSGYMPAGTHDGAVVGGGNYVFTNDVPVGFTGQSLLFTVADTAISINNSSTLDPAYTNTFDAPVRSHITVAFWAKGTRDSWSWNPWVSKNGEGATGWQFRTGGSSVLTPVWTVRDGAGSYVLGGGPDWNKTLVDDLHAATSGAGASAVNYPLDNQWHFFVGTYNAVTGVKNLYIDGVLRGQEVGNPLYGLADNTPVVIGGRYNAGTGIYEAFSTFNIFDVRIYNYDLNAEQVIDLMPNPVIGIQPPASINAYVGGTTRISAGNIGVTAPITNRWQFNGVDLANGPFGGAIISGADTPTLTISYVTTNLQGVFRLIVSNSKGTAISSNTTVTVLSPSAPPAGNLVGSWLTGAANLADTSGYTPAGTHNGFGVTGAGLPSSNYVFTNDVPPGKTGQSLTLIANTAIAISNSSVLDVTYTNTFDETITNMTVMLWAKGWPAAWDPFISKYGEAGQGWQLRRNGQSSPAWTVRGAGVNEDMSAAGLTMSNDGLWHHYAGTFTFDVATATGTRNLYVDGILVASQAESIAYMGAPVSYLTIGGRDNGGNTFGNYFSGSIYGVQVFKTALNESQINSFLVSSIPPAPVFGKPSLTGNKLVLTWSGGSLLQSTNLAGPWSPTGATSPFTNDVTTAPQRFYKLTNQ